MSDQDLPTPSISDDSGRGSPEGSGEFPVPPISEPTPPPTRRSFKLKPKAKKPKATKNAPASEAQTKQRTNAAATAKRKRVEAEARAVLVKWRGEFGTVALTRAPVVGVYILRTDDEVIDAAVRLAGKNARVLEGLAASGDLLAVLVLARWGGGLAVAVGVETGRVDPGSMISEQTGVGQIVKDLQAEGIVEIGTAEGVPSDDASRTDDAAAPREVAPAPVAVARL